MSNYSQSPPTHTGAIQDLEDGSVGKQHGMGGPQMVRLSIMPTGNGESQEFGPADTRQTRDETYKTRQPPKPAATNDAPNITMSAHQSTYHQNQHDQTTCSEFPSSAQCPLAPVQYLTEAKCKTSSAPKHSQALSPPQVEHTLSAVERDFEVYEPMKRWEDEKFQEQAWHGIARELMSDE
jgi:hypothetical protein